MASSDFTGSKISSVTAVRPMNSDGHQDLGLPADVRGGQVAQRLLLRAEVEARAQAQVLAGDAAMGKQRRLGRTGGTGGEDHLRAVELGQLRAYTGCPGGSCARQHLREAGRAGDAFAGRRQLNEMLDEGALPPHGFAQRGEIRRRRFARKGVARAPESDRGSAAPRQDSTADRSGA